MRTDEARELLDAERRHLELARDALLLHAGPDGGSQRDDTGELSGIDEHTADAASDTLEREVDLGLLHAVQGELAEVDAALKRVAAGTYGRCQTCGAAIADNRLRAVPAALLCLDDQQVAERVDGALRRSILHGGVDFEAAAHLDLLPEDETTAMTTSAEEDAVHLIGP